MWTPRRILLLLAGLLGFGAAYLGYSRFLGAVDGLPTLPEKFLEIDDKPLPEQKLSDSETVTRLREAFGALCPETGYPTKLEMREQGLVFAAGRAQTSTAAEPSPFVRLSPGSIALFAKPRPLAERDPGEVVEVSTLHADEMILEYDRPIASNREMVAGKAKLIGVELRSAPDPSSIDPRNGRVVITNNQRLADPSRALVVKTPGPVFYRTANHPDANNPNVPHINTTAAVEVVNRDNLPRQPRGGGLPVVPMASDDGLYGNIVADMALGLHTAPPTVTADGMKIFFKRDEPAPAAKGKKESTFAGVREMVLCENVLFSLWIDGNSGFPGGTAKDGKAAKKADLPAAAAALLGGLPDGRTASDRLYEKALLRIRTLGPFRFDTAKNTGRFEIAPQPNPLLPNNVEVTRLLPLGGKDYLVCQLLEIEFNGPIAGRPTPRAGAAKDRGPAFKSLHATGTNVLVAATTDQFQAQGTALHYESDAATGVVKTILRGAPLSAVRNRNVLTAGAATRPGELILTTLEPPVGSKAAKMQLATIDGPGRIDMFDDTGAGSPVTASWTQSMVQSRDRIGDADADLYVFNGDGTFADDKAGFRLTADIMKLWLKPGETKEASAKPTPHLLHGLGHVVGHSTDSQIDKTDVLTVMFQDAVRSKVVTPPTVVAAFADPRTAAAPLEAPAGARPVLASRATTDPPFMDPVATVVTERPKQNPIRLSARKVDVWVKRYAAEAKVPDAVVYEMDSAKCEDRVVVLQDPTDPKKNPVGLDIRAAGLTLHKRANGSTMTALGSGETLAIVKFEAVTLAGPTVNIDEPNNSVKVDGRGWVVMPASSDLAGGAVTGKTEITVNFQTSMRFLGERRWAEFLGLVQAVQQPAEGQPPTESFTRSYVLCHHLDVTFDRPIYFNQMKKDDPAKKPGAPAGDPKVETVVCSPLPDDGDGGALRPGAANRVVFVDETFDTRTKKHSKAQRIEAKLLDVRVDNDRSLIAATGPGTTRTLQLGSKDSGPGTPAVAGKPAEEEMKLTIIRFATRLDMEDRKQIFQKAVYRDNVRVVNVPGETLDVAVDDFALPPRSVFLKCNNTLTVSSYKAKTGTEDTKQMEAVDGAEVRTDEYIGAGHTIMYDGAQVILRGRDEGMATLYRRQRTLDGQDHKSGNPLVYNTKTGQVSGAQSSGGTFSTGK